MAAVIVLAFATVSVSLGVSAQTRTVVDVLGRSVTIKSPVERVIICFNYEEFTAIAGKDGWTKVVGMSKALWAGWRPAIFARYAAVIPNLAAMPDVGNTEDGNFSAEAVIALKPDVVIMAAWSFQNLKTAGEQLAAAGIPIVVIDYNAQTVERHAASTRAVGAVMGAERRAEELAALYEREVADIRKRIAAAPSARKTTVYVELGRDGAESIGNSYSGNMWGKILDTLGADNIANGQLAGPWGPLAPEYVIARNPEVIFIAGSSWVNKPKAVKTGYETAAETTRASLAPYLARPGWSTTRAVQGQNVHAIEHGLARALFDFTAMQYIAKQLYPEQFADVDPIKALKAFHEAYLPVEFSGTWMVGVQP